VEILLAIEEDGAPGGQGSVCVDSAGLFKEAGGQTDRFPAPLTTAARQVPE